MKAEKGVFSVIRAVLLRPPPYRDAHQLYEMTGVDANARTTAVSVADFLSLRDRTASVEQMAISARLPNYLISYLMTGVPEPATVFAPPVDARFLTTIGVTPQLGRTFTAEECAPGTPRVAVISHRLWQQSFLGDSHTGSVGRGAHVRWLTPSRTSAHSHQASSPPLWKSLV